MPYVTLKQKDACYCPNRPVCGCELRRCWNRRNWKITNGCVECRVEYDYIAQEDDELNLKKGDTITNVVQKMEGWWEGTLRGKTGMFPDNFVKVIEKSSSSGAPPPMETPDTTKTDSGSNSSSSVSVRSNGARRLRALFSYAPEQEDELRLEVGDEIDFITEVEEGWWRGNLKGRVGIFPSNFVADSAPPTNGKADPDVKSNDLNSKPSSKGVPDVIPAVPTSPPPEDDPEPAPELPPKPVREQVRCFFPYKAQNEDELNLNEGDIVTIISKNCEDEGWWRGESKGKIGLFPDNFVRTIPLNESSMNHSSKSTTPTVQPTKMSPQGRNLAGVKPILPGGTIETNGVDKSNGSSEVDGIGSSKGSEKQEEENESVLSKVKRFSKPIGMYPPLKPTTPTSPSTPTGKPPLTFSLSAERENKRESLVIKDDGKTEEMGDFNSIERGDKLNHLTVSRAKAPKRRPPSTSIVTRDEDEENEIMLTNGNTHSAMNDSLDSPPVNHSTPFNSTLNSTGSVSLLDASQETNNSASSTPSNTSGSAKPKKLLPWMAELKQKQDKKSTTSNIFNASSSPSSATSPASLPPVVSTSSLLPSSQIKEKEPVPTPTPVPHAKAPPLPAKPTSLSTSVSVDKTSVTDRSPSGLNNTATITPGSTAQPAPLISNRAFVMNKKPAPVTPSLNNHVNSAHDINASGDTIKQFVPYEDYAKLRDRVSVLESELELLRRQVKMLMDRDSSHGHIV